MKYIWLLLLTACSNPIKYNSLTAINKPIFKVGDCIRHLANDTTEKWDILDGFFSSPFKHLIRDVGKRSYKVSFCEAKESCSGNNLIETRLDIFFSDETYYKKVSCN